MPRTRHLLPLIVLFATLTASAQVDSPVLVTVELSTPSAPAFFDRLHPRVYYASESWALVELSAEQVDLARRAGHAVTAVDTRPDPGSYRLVTKKKGPVVRADISGARVLIERDGIVITRGNPVVDGSRSADGLKSVALQPLSVALDAGSIVGSPVINAATDSLIASIVARVNPDTVRWFIQQLQNFGTRYAYASTRDSVAEWIKSQFVRMGYTNARRDTFSYGGIAHTNVIATLPGSGPSDQIIVFGGHHDSNSGTPHSSAPGADDNASGTAAALETARILAESGHTPEVTVKFITFAAEEIGLVGSRVDAERSSAAGTNIKLMINHDMIANNPGPAAGSRVRVYYYSGSEAWRELAKHSTGQFSGLVGVNGGLNSGGSDSYHYWAQGYSAVYFFEDVFSPVYHSPADTIGNLNIPYCAEVIKASAATLLRAAAIPDAVRRLEIVDRGDGVSLLATWEPGLDGAAVLYRVSVGQAQGAYDSSFAVSDTSVIVGGLTPGTRYYVGVAPVDAQGDQGMIVEKTGTPLSAPLTPTGFTATPDRSAISLQWQANAELDLLGYNVYRSETPGDQGSLLTPVPIVTASYTDTTPQKHVFYFYTLRAVDSLLNESPAAGQLRSRIVSLDPGILLVDETADGSGTTGDPSDEQVDDFYGSLVSGYISAPYDVKAEEQIGLAEMGAFSVVVWYNDDLAESAASFVAREDVRKYIEFGGNLLYSGYRPGRAFTGSSATAAQYGPGDFMYDVLGIDSTELRIFSRFSGAGPMASEYPAVRVDSSKAASANAYHLRQIENISGAPGASEVYFYDSWYDTSEALGGSKGKPVGVEFAGLTGKSVVLSFPLYYMMGDDAQALVKYVIEDRFGESPTGLDENPVSLPSSFSLEQNYPNPFNPKTVIKFHLSAQAVSVGQAGSGGPEWATLSVYDILGREIAVLVNEPKSSGSYEVAFDAGGLASGVYLYRLTWGSFTQSRKMLLLQ